MIDRDETLAVGFPEDGAGEAWHDGIELMVSREQQGERLDRFVTAHLPEHSRSHVQHLIDAGYITVDGASRKPKFKVTPGEVIRVSVPEPEPTGLEPEAIPLSVVYEDADILVIDKPAGMVVHPAPGHPRGTLVNALLAHAPEISIGGTNRPGLVHRLDKDTSGLMVVAKSDRARNSLAAQWEERTVQKGYVALAVGLIEPTEGTIDVPIGRDPNQRQRMAVVPRGRPAVTHFVVRRRFGDQTLLDVEIESGRTHQIRVHFAFIGHPVAGDNVYGRRTESGTLEVPRQFLHAARLGFALPDGRPIAFESPLPSDLQAVLDQLDDLDMARPV